MPDYTKVSFAGLRNNLAEGEHRMARDALDSPQVGIAWIRLPPGGDVQGDGGHYHDEQDEVYVLVSGGPVEMKLDDETIMLESGEAVRIGAGVTHALRNRGDEAIVIAVSGRLPEAGDDSHPVDGFWPRAG